MFHTDYSSIQNRILSIDPIEYAKSRNFSDGKVSLLSPYISRGVISTKDVMKVILDKFGYNSKTEKFIQELAWRDYWQLVWQEKNIDKDIKKEQENVDNHNTPTAITEGKTGIDAIDKSIDELYQTGYLHNHMRMYIAFLSCNLAKSHWREPAKWMYYHLLDGDWASNALSWQWVAGCNSNKKYIANQENINKYFYSNQKGSYLDISYEELSELNKPDRLIENINVELETPLNSIVSKANFDAEKPTLIYNYYNLDPLWHSKGDYNRIYLLEPSVFKRYPISQKSLDFSIELSKNITNIQYYVGEFEDLILEHKLNRITYKEHPLNNYKGQEEERDWMFKLNGYFPSFFKYWNKAKKELKEYAS